MAIKHYIATKDTTIANSYQANLSTTATGSNMGAADVTEVFSIWGQVSSSASGNSLEASRALYQFDISNIITDRTAGDIPISGSVDFVLKLSNAEHRETTPQNYDISVVAVSESWSEGSGLDLDNYRDIGQCNWNYRTSASPWGDGGASAKGGVFHTGSVEAWSNEIQFKKTFGEDVTEDLEINITPLVEHWIDDKISNNGLAVMMSGTYEDGSRLRSFYTKKFFARNSEFFFKRPRIEARWDSSKKDDRANFYASSSLGDAENTNTIYLYNYLRGQLTNIPGLHERNTLTVKLYRDALTDTGFAATAKITALSKTSGQANTRVLTVHDAEGQSVSFTIDNSISTSTATKIAFANANSNATQFATNIAAAINAADTAGTLNISATSADAIVTLTMNTVGSAGNSVSDIAGTAATDSVLTVTNQFSGGGVTEIIGGLTADTGIYTASFALDTTASVIYDVWLTGSTQFYTGSIAVKSFTATVENPNSVYNTSIVNLKPSYSTKETARFRFFVRKQNWSPTIYNKATETLNSEVISSAYYRIFRISDNYEVIPYGTGSEQHTKMSYDQSGSYFDLDMSMLQKDYAYGLSLAYYLNGKYVEQPEVFKFRVEG